MTTLEELRKGAELHRRHRRRQPSEYKRNFFNAEYFAVFDNDSAEPLIEPIGWALRFLETDGDKSTRAVHPATCKAVAKQLGLRLLSSGEAGYDDLWEQLKVWRETAKIPPLSARSHGNRRGDTFFFVASASP
ncbi:hypothetical protein LCL97_02480 [Seohaeicola saemankumensis]|nr:hypothetical protein [Seohaeicola saemankumensis]MCA0869682.1 hypothetical protein [Seohaeicola saemankumensis]